MGTNTFNRYVKYCYIGPSAAFLALIIVLI